MALESRIKKPLIPLTIFRIPGLAAAEITQVIGVGGFLVVSLGIGGVLVGTTTAANAGVPRPSPG